MESLLDHPWVLGLLVALLLAGVIEAGYQTAVRGRIQENQNRKEQMVAIRDGLFVLTSLLLGFTLALAAPRYADRRSLLIEEANSIGTSYLRAGTLPEGTAEQARKLLGQYVDARLDLDNAGLDTDRAAEAAGHAKRIQEELWETVLGCTKTDRSAVTASYMNSLNQTIDLHEKRISAFENRVPRSCWLLIFSVAIIAVFTRGATLTGRFWLTLLLAPLTIAIVVALIADLDTPSSGLIRLDQRAMLRLKAELTQSH
jgi:hypothetical protein